MTTLLLVKGNSGNDVATLRKRLAAVRAKAADIRRLREAVPGPGPDRYLAPEIEATVRLLGSGDLLAAAEVASRGQA